MQRYFQFSCHALVVSAFVALALTGRLDFPSISVFAIGLAISFYRTFRGLPPLLMSRGASFASFAYMVFFFFDSVILSRSFIPATIHLVLFLQLAKLFQDKKDRDYLYLIILAFLQILAASSLTVNISFAVTLFVFLIALVSTLMSFEMYRSERKVIDQTQQIAVPLGGMSLWATIWIILVGVVLFFSIPRIGTGYFSRAAAPSLLLSGFTESVELGDIGQVKLSSAVVMHARQISGTPFGVLKWRGIALDAFNGHNWYKTDRRHFGVRPSRDGQYWLRPVEQSGDFVQYEFILEPLALTTLFGPHQVRAVSLPQPGMETDNDGSIYMRFQTGRRVQYQVLSEIPNRTRLLTEPTPEQPIPPQIIARYLQVPDELDPRIPQLAREITAKGKSAMEKASLVESYLKRNYAYTLNLTWSPGPQPLSTFLFTAKAGHCEYFASSMAILLRTAGIPTRLVNGFLMGEYNPVSGDYIVRQSNAHSWVEIYVSGNGWIEFDPTPPDPNTPEINLAMQLSHYVDAAELFWNSYILTYDSGTQLQLFRSAQDKVESIQTTARDKSDRWVRRVQMFSDRFSALIGKLVGALWFWIAAAAAILGGIVYKDRRTLWTNFEIWRVRQGKGAVNEDVVEQLFYRAVRIVEGRLHKRLPAETWREWIFGLPDPNRRSILTRALEIFEKAKYGHMPITAAEFTLLEETIRELKMN